MLLLSGKARVGKTTAAKLFAELFYKAGYKPVMLPFAAALKSEVEAMGITKEKQPEEYRKLCQKLGSDRRREDPDYWVNKFIESAYNIQQEENDDVPERVIIADDCRYLNEINLAPRFNAFRILITHGNRQIIEQDAEWRNHESEEMANKSEEADKDYVTMYDFIIRNTGTEKALTTKIKDNFPIMVDCMYNKMIEPLCECELCLATRYDRPVCIERLEEQVLDELTKMFPEEEEDGTT